MLTIESVNHVTVVHFDWPGIVDETEIARIGDQLLHLVETLGEPQIVLDLGNAPRASSGFVRVLADVHKEAIAAGGRLALARVTADLLKGFRLNGLDRVLNSYATESAAVESFFLETAPA
jgi:anti-anti-sigma factor